MSPDNTMAALGGDLDENYERFLAEAEETGCVWGLDGPDGFALCSSNLHDKLEVIPLWSQPEFAQAHVMDEWKGCKVVPISLEEFLDDWLPGLHEDLLLVGINWTKNLEGEEVEPLDLLADFEG